jgi:hypothetical protein
MGRRWAAIGLVSLGIGIISLLPLFMAVFPHYGLTRDTPPETVLATVAIHRWLFVAPGVVQLFGHTAGAIGMIALAHAWEARRSLLLLCATFFGLAWMAIDLADNAITLTMVPDLAASYANGETKAVYGLTLLRGLTDAARLGAHFAGGLWVVGVSYHLWQHGSRKLGGIGLFVGAVLAANVFLPPLMFLSMMTLPFWLMALGVAVTKAAESIAARTVGGTA